MGFSEKQRGQLNRAPAAEHVRTREHKGREVCFLDAWRAIEAANRIFGPDGWDRETMETRCASSKQNGAVLTAAYVAKVRISVHVEGRTIVREGQGCGEGRGETPFEAHDTGLKAAETDATKRALATFGRALGLGFYLGEQPRRPKNSKPPRRSSAAPDKDTDPAADAGRSATAQDGDDASGPDAGDGEGAQPPPPDREPASTRSGGEKTEQRRRTECEASSATASYDGGIQQTDRLDRPPPLSTSPGCGAMLIPKERRVRDREHLRYVASQPCLICDRAPADAHHLRFAQPTAMAKKVSDEFTVPLCRLHHRQLHRDSDERGWWRTQGIDPLEVAEDLWKEHRRP